MKGNFIMYFRLLSFTWQRHFKIFDICINNTREQSRAEQAGSVAAWQAKPRSGQTRPVWQICIIAYSYVADLSWQRPTADPELGKLKKRRHYAKYAEQLPYRSVEFHETETMSQAAPVRGKGVDDELGRGLCK